MSGWVGQTAFKGYALAASWGQRKFKELLQSLVGVEPLVLLDWWKDGLEEPGEWESLVLRLGEVSLQEEEVLDNLGRS